MATDKIPVGISSCLLGEKVRYDGGHKYNAYIAEDLAEHFEYIAFCPEVDIGLAVPREPIHLIQDEDKVHCVGVNDSRKDVTQDLMVCSDKQRDWHRRICGYIFKSNSPSCGVAGVKVVHDGQYSYTGVGIYARQLMKNFPQLPVAEESQFDVKFFRDQFVHRICVYSQWQSLLNQGVTWPTLKHFHEQIQNASLCDFYLVCDPLDRLLSEPPTEDIKVLSQVYFSKLMSLLAVEPE